MAVRPVDIAFGVDELLWRRISKSGVNAKGLKASALRPQISVVRQRYAEIDSVPSGSFNGIAETTASAACRVSLGDVRFVCVDEPLDGNPGHCLIAAVLAPGQPAENEVINGIRTLLALEFRIERAPT